MDVWRNAPRFLHMRRSVWFRLLSFVCGFWLLVGLTEPAALHACPMHGAHSAHMGHGHAGMSSGEHAMQTAHSSRGHDHAAICTCVGDCSLSVAATVPTTAPVLVAMVRQPQSRVDTPAANAFRLTAPRYARPPTIGPPRLTA